MKKFVQVQVSTAIWEFQENYTQTLENIGFLMLRFLHVFINLEKMKDKQ